MDVEEELVDAKRVKNYFAYVRGSVRRRLVLVLGCFLGVISAAALALLALPKSYHVEAKLLAQRNAALSVRSDANGADAPTRAAAELVLKHDNLMALIRSTDLIRHYAAHLAPAQRARAWAMHWFQRDWTEEDRLEGMVELLEKQFHVWSSDGTVTISIDWPDAHMAYRLVDYAQQSFLEARHIQEISSTAESVAILQSHAAALRTDIDTAVDAIKDLRKDRAVGPPASKDDAARTGATGARTRAAYRSSGDAGEVTRLRVMIDAKQRALDELEDARRHRLLELQGKLAEQRAVYTENHPTIIDLKQTIVSLSSESPQVFTLKKEVGELRDELQRKAPQRESASDAPGASAASPSIRAIPPQLPSDIVSFELGPPEERDPAMVYARGQLRDAMEKYAALRSQIQGAQIELETAEAAFKYRYAVVTPAQVPRRPAKPNALIVILAAILGGMFFGVLAAVVADIRSGRIIERWQVELVLDRPILGEVEVHALPQGPGA